MQGSGKGSGGHEKGSGTNQQRLPKAGGSHFIYCANLEAFLETILFSKAVFSNRCSLSSYSHHAFFTWVKLGIPTLLTLSHNNYLFSNPNIFNAFLPGRSRQVLPMSFKNQQNLLNNFLEKKY